jgi:hypothetical protein
MLLPCPDDSIRCPAIQYQIPNRVAYAPYSVQYLFCFFCCAAAALLLPFALALALILAARRPQPASHSILKGRGLPGPSLCCTFRCGAVLESLHNCQQLHAPALLPFPSFAELYPRRIVSIFARLTPSPFAILGTPLPSCPPAPLPPLATLRHDPLPLCRRANSSAASARPRVTWRVLACPGASLCSPPHSRK